MTKIGFSVFSVAFLVGWTTTLTMASQRSDDCRDKLNENFLEKQTTYEYNYLGLASTSAVGTTNLENRMEISCQVHIQHDMNCLFKMSTKECKLKALQKDDSGKERSWINEMDLDALNRYSLPFTLIEGRVIHVFADPNDPLYSVNIKRGIISAFVMRKSDFQEGTSINKTQIDVQGSCPATITSDGPNSVHMSKDMLYCAVPKRNDYHFSPYSMFWNMSFIQYVINSTNECDYKSDGKSLTKIKCHERHAIMLESTALTTAAVQTNIHYTMDLKSIKSGEKGPRVSLEGLKELGIEFEYEQDPSQPDQNPKDFLAKTLKMLSDLVTTSENEIRLFTIEIFHRFVEELRTSADLIQLTRKVIECEHLEEECNDLLKDLSLSYLQDGLVQCNSGPCLKAFAYLVDKKLVSKAYIELALFAMTNVNDFQTESLDAVVSICKSTNYRFCWLAFGVISRKYFEERNMLVNFDDLSPDVLDQLKFVSNYPKDTNCGNLDSKSFEMRLTDFKIIGNLGQLAQFINPHIVLDLLTCSKMDEPSEMVKVASLEAMRKMDASPEMYPGLVNILKDDSNSVEVRTSAYNLLIGKFDNPELVRELLTILKSETEPQVKGYVASDLQNILNHPDLHKHLVHLPSHLKSALKEEIFDLDEIVIDDDKISNRNVEGEFERFDFLPKEIRGFGSLLKSEYIFNTLSFFPETVRANWTLELFSKTFNLIDFGIQTGGWEGMILKTYTILKTLQEPNAFQFFSLIMQQLSVEPGRKKIQLRPVYLLDKKIEEGINKLKKIFTENHSQLKPYLMAYVRMFGNDLDLTTLDDLLKYVRKTFQQMSSTQPNSLQGPKSYSWNTTRVFNFIEARHQFPTMMGLPLNWTTDAHVAFSIRTGVESNLKAQQTGQAGLYFHPSASGTFINRMILDLPTITNIGVQANSSAYTSNKFDFEVSKPSNAPLKISLKVQPDLQKTLELFRTNYYIENGQAVELKDWDIQRKESVQCLSDEFEKLSGVRICVDKSYADVTERVKPWALMAGSAKWRLTGLKTDKDLKTYEMSVQFSNNRKTNEKGLSLKLEAPGTTLKRSVPIELKFDTSTGESKLEVSHSDYPDFTFNVDRTRIISGQEQEVKGHTSTILLKKDGKTYQFFYSKEKGQEARSGEATGRNKSPKPENLIAKVDERKIKITTPFNHYQLTSKVHNNAGSIKADIVINYDNTNPEWNWLSKILPTIFWENDGKAWIELRGNWRAPTNRGKGINEQLTTTNLNIPYSITEVVTRNTDKPKHNQFTLNMTKKERSTSKLLTFLTFSHNLWQKGNEELSREVRVLNLTIPRHSWAADILCEKGKDQSTHRIELIDAKMIYKDEADSSYSGWWNPLHSDRFEHQERKIVYDQRIKHRDGTEQDFRDSLKEKLDLSESNQDYHKFGKKVTTADIKLTYPFKGQTEFVEFNGTFKFLGNERPSYWSFLKDFVVQSSLNKVKLDSSTTFIRMNSYNDYLVHNSFLTNTESLRNQGNYNMEYIRSSNDHCRSLIDFRHNITAHWLEFSSNTSVACKPGKPKAKLISVDISAHNPYWKELDMELRQTFDFDMPGGESMNLTSETVDIAVVGEWSKKHYKKKVIFNSKSDLFPSSNWLIKVDSDHQMEFIINIPEQEISTIIVKRQINHFKTKIGYTVAHKHRSDAEDEHEDADVSLHLTSPHSLLISGQIDEGTVSKFGKYLNEHRIKIVERIKEKLNDPNHEINVQMVPVLGMTVGGYLRHLKTESEKMAEYIVDEISERSKTYSSFYEPTIQIYKNVVDRICKLGENADQRFRETVPGWAYYYFDVPSILDEISEEMPSNIRSLAQSYLTGGSSGKSFYKFHQSVPHPFTWKKLDQMPKFSVSKSADVAILNFVEAIFRTSYLERPRVGPLHKIGMYFSESGVLTFDGLIYRSSKYPKPDCGYLLAHDSRAGTFSVITRETSLNIIFAEMAIVISADGSVRFNDSLEEHGLPVESPNGEIKVSREGAVIRVESPAITIDCDQKGFFCIFVLESWVHSGTIGLLGNANGNPKDDFNTPDGRTVQSSSELMSAFEVTQQPFCKKVENVIESKLVSKEEMEKCQSFLESNLELEECSKRGHFDKMAFVKSCAYELGNEKCYTVKALQALCAYHGFESDKCVECPDSPVIPDSVIPSSHKLQIVLLVDQHSSMFQNGNSSAIKGLETLLNGVDELFRMNGYTSVSFSLIGFGGDQIRSKPRMHTLRSQPWVNEKEVPTLLKTLQFSGKERSNPIKALEYSINVLEFEPSASKVALLFTVDDEMKPYGLLHRVHAAQKLISESGLTLYTFASFPTIEKGKKVYGLRADGLIFPGNGGEQYMSYPKSPCAKLTSATRGAIFLRSFVEENVNANFFYGFSEEIFAKVGKETKTCKTCKCARNHLWNQFLACHSANCQ